MCILLIETPDLTKSESLVLPLETTGHRIYLADSPQVAATAIKDHWPNLIVFNRDHNPLTLTSFRQVLEKANLEIPYLVVQTASHPSDDDPDDVTAISAKDANQLIATIEKAIAQQAERFIRLPNLIIDCHQHRILRDKKDHKLTPKEFKLLFLFLSNSDQVLSRKTIMQEVWDTDYMGDTRTLDVHIRWLREKIEENPSHPRRLITVRGVGYHFVTEIE